tara:strand:+ start:170 stop:487 length:318 start_codon:yes stop_codon:yes gene_type:complete
MRAGYRRSVRRAMSGRRSRRVGRGRSARRASRSGRRMAVRRLAGRRTMKRRSQRRKRSRVLVGGNGMPGEEYDDCNDPCSCKGLPPPKALCDEPGDFKGIDTTDL